MTNSKIFYKENLVKIFIYFRLRTLNKEIAEDLTSETITRYISITANSKPENNKAFLFGIAKNVFLEFLKNKYKQELSISKDIADAENELEDYIKTNIETETRWKEFFNLLPKLPIKQREVLSLRMIDKLTLGEIAKKLGKDSNYVRTTQKRGIANMRKLWACTQQNTNILELTQNYV